MKFTRCILAVVLPLVLLLINSGINALADSTLTMPDALQIIEEEAFYGSTSIDKVVLSNKVKEIRARAFANSTLSEINLPDSLTFIADDAFVSCESLINCYITSDAIEQKCIDIGLPYVKYTKDGNGVCITKYACYGPSIILPNNINGQPVTSILFSAFSNFTEVFIPEGFTVRCASIEEAGIAFRNVLKQRSKTIIITYPIQLSEFDNKWREQLLSITFADTGEADEGEYFERQFPIIGLSSEYKAREGEDIPTLSFKLVQYQTATTVDQEQEVSAAIENVLTSLNLTGKNEYEKISAIYNWICVNVVYDTEHYENDLSLGFNAHSDFTIEVDESLIPHSAYGAIIMRKAVCSGYASLLNRMLNAAGIDSRVISGYANNGFHDWNIVRIGDLYYNVDCTWDSILYQQSGSYQYFLKCNSNFSDHYRDSQYCTPEYNASHPMSAFDYGVNLDPKDPDEIIYSGELNNGITWTLTGDGTLTFEGDGIVNENPVSDKALIQKLVFKSGITAVDDSSPSFSEGLFSGLYNLQAIEFGETLETIGNSVFSNNPSIQSLYFPDTIHAIGETAFRLCRGLKTINLPSKITELSLSVFAQCSCLESIEIPASVEIIGACAFDSCKHLKTVILHEGLEFIGNGAFAQTGIISIMIPDTVSVIEFSAFCDCADLEEIHIPSGLTKIPSNLFCRCRKLVSIDIPDTVEEIEYNAFYATGITSIRLPQKLTEISGHLFQGCTKLSEIILPDGITAIGEYAFSETAITSFVVPAGVDRIENGTFASCYYLETIELHNNIDSIGNQAFVDTALTEIHIPNSVSIIKERTFQGCRSLKQIYIPNSVVQIEKDAFLFCRNLKTIVYNGSEEQWNSIICEEDLKNIQINFINEI